MTVRPRRSVLYMPGSNRARAGKGARAAGRRPHPRSRRRRGAGGQSAAREAIVKALKTGFGDREVLVRINGLDTRWWVEDLNAVARPSPTRCWCRKSRPPGMQDLAARIVDMGTDPQVRVWAMMETPLAMLNVGEIAAAALDSETRLAGFVMGTNDLAKDTRARLVPGRAPMLPWLMTASPPRAPTASIFSTASITTSATPKALPRSASRRAISASTARRSFIRNRSSRATKRSRRRRKRWRSRAR